MEPVLFANRYALTGKVRDGRLFTELPARDTTTGDGVVLWLPHERLLPTPAGRARFVAEARRATSAPLAGTLPVHDAGDDERVYLAVPDVRRLALPLAALVEHSAGLPATALAIARRVAPILDAAHAQGVVHGFLSLRDVWMWRSRIAVAGLGLWRLFDRAALLDLLAAEPAVAPEVREGAPLSAAADVYALGALCARLSVGGAGWQGTLGRLYPRVAAALVPALAAEPAERPASGADVVAALVDALTPRRTARGSLPPAATPGRRSTTMPHVVPRRAPAEPELVAEATPAPTSPTGALHRRRSAPPPPPLPAASAAKPGARDSEHEREVSGTIDVAVDLTDLG